LTRGSESGIESGCDRDTEQRGKVHIRHMEIERGGRGHVHKRRDSEEETEREGGGAAICKAKKST